MLLGHDYLPHTYFFGYVQLNFGESKMFILKSVHFKVTVSFTFNNFCDIKSKNKAYTVKVHLSLQITGIFI